MTRPEGLPILKLEGLSVGYHGRALVDGITFELAPGTIACVVGRNGSGKSTVLRTIAGQLNPLGGRVLVNGRPASERRLWRRARIYRIGFLVQGQRHFPALSVREHLHLALWYSRKNWRAREFEIQRLVDDPPFSALANAVDRSASTLSGGQDMILGLAKCVLQDCQLLLLDEPSTGLSVVHRNEVFPYLRVLAEHRAILMVEQSMSVAFGHSDVVYQIRKRAGQGPEEALACVRVNADVKASIAASYRAGRAAEASDAVAALLGGGS